MFVQLFATLILSDFLMSSLQKSENIYRQLYY